MSLVTIIGELWRFFINNVVKMLIGAVVLSALFMGGKFFLDSRPVESPEAEAGTEEVEDIKAVQDESFNYLNQVYAQQPAEFEVVLINEEGTTFPNSYLLDEYFATPKVIRSIEEKTGINFEKWYDSEQNLGLIKTVSHRGGLAALTDSSTGIITFRFLVGQSAEENLKIAQAYADLLTSGQVPITEGLNVTLVSEPKIANAENLKNPKFQEIAASPESLNALVDDSGIALSLYGVAGLIVGFILMFVVLFILQLFKRKIAYAFDYTWDFEDKHVIYNQKNAERNGLADIVFSPQRSSRVVVSEDNAAQEILTGQSHPHQMAHLIQANKLGELDDRIEEIVLLIHSGQTSKDWYRHQYEMATLYDAPLKIVLIV